MVSGMSQKLIVLKGLLVSLRCPYRDDLRVYIDVSRLSTEEIDELRDRLNNAIQDLENRYTGKHTKRMIKILWNEREVPQLLPSGQIGKVKKKVAMIEFNPFPAKWLNKIEEARVKAYHAINEYGQVAQKMQTGTASKTLYLLPLTTAGEFFRRINELNKELEEVRSALRQFIHETNGLEEIRRILADYDIVTTKDLDDLLKEEEEGEGDGGDAETEKKEKKGVEAMVKSIHASVTPIALDAKTALNMIDEVIEAEEAEAAEARAGAGGGGRRRRSGSNDGNLSSSKTDLVVLREMLTESIENARIEMINTVLSSLRARIATIVEQCLLSEARAAVAERKIRILEKILQGIGLYDKKNDDDEETRALFERLRTIVRQKTVADKKELLALYFQTTDKEALVDIISKRLLKE